jgi:hypothetical protein
MRTKVYISGPLSKGCPDRGRNWNFYQAAVAQSRLMEAGYSCFNPMLSMCQQDQLDWECWLECDEAWIAVSDLVLRLPGASVGSERELDFARRHNIPIVLPAFFPCLRDLFPDERIYLPQDKHLLGGWFFAEPLDDRLRADVEEAFDAQ